ncbi:hypothetical protein AB0H94_35695 [Streptomyces purpurascens]|uniref:hypothetical protein n=1 Tax=Streptomyces purpurascens TaxID=1924 RepID=UPI0033DEDB8C
MTKKVIEFCSKGLLSPYPDMQMAPALSGAIFVFYGQRIIRTRASGARHWRMTHLPRSIGTTAAMFSGQKAAGKKSLVSSLRAACPGIRGNYVLKISCRNGRVRRFLIGDLPAHEGRAERPFVIVAR